MRTINEVTSALSSSRYEWPQVRTSITQYGGHSVGIDLDMTDLRPDLVDQFISQFKSPVKRYTPTGISIDVRVGAIEVMIDIEVSSIQKGI